MKFYTRFTLFLVFFSVIAFSAKALTAGFTADVTAGCAPLVTKFTNTSTGATGYFWDFGTGTTSTLPDPSTSFTKPGTYTVKLTVYGPGGPITTTMTITVYPDPTVSFTASDLTVCPGSPVTFTSTTIGGVPGPITYLWAFGDGSIGTGSSPTHTYSIPGFYNITLTATNSMGCTSTLTKTAYLEVVSPPNPDFSAKTYYCKVPSSVTFTNLSTGSPTLTYVWDFGDGGTSTATTPTHTYAALGSYTVKLTVTDGNGCTETTTKPAYITLGTIAASFTSVTTACVNTLVTFPNTSTPHISSTWDYGDGGTGFTDAGSHTYTTAGTYTVALVIFDGGCYDTVKQTIKILAGPTISFTQNPAQPCPPPVGITFTGTAPSGTTIKWDFGDGGTGSGMTASHTYTKSGVYVITMTGTDPVTGCVSQVTRRDTLFDMDFGITASDTTGCRPLTVKFNYYANTHEPGLFTPKPYPYGVASFYWTFGDGTTTTTSTPTHTYTAVGTYKAYLTIVTGNGCTFTDTVNIYVGAPPVVTFTATPTHVCYGDSVRYVATVVSGPVDDYYWEFGDWYKGTMGRVHDTDGKITYKDRVPGVFTVTLTPSYRGCAGVPYVLTNYITVDSPMALATDSVLCSPARRVQFGDSSLGDDSRLWIFGDGTTSTARNPFHDYPLATTYAVILATYNSKSGCRDTTTLTVNLTAPKSDFTASKTTICPHDVVTFTATMTGGVATSYLWTGGGIFEGGGPTGFKGPVIADTFHTGGIYPIRLVVTDQNGCTDTVTKPNYIKVADPIVKFSATPVTGCWPLTVTFTDASTDLPGFSIVGRAWAFGDGGVASGPSTTVSHTFVTAGTFATTLTVTNSLGCKASLTQSLVTVWRPDANFSAPKNACVGDTVNFANLSSGGVVSSFWTFGDGGTSTAMTPTHVYTAPGLYTISLAVVDGNGCTDTATFTNYINVTEVIASFFMDDSFSICPPLIVNFTNTSIGAVSYAWDLGDGTSSSIKDPKNFYITTGVYKVMLVAVNAYGCQSVAFGNAIIFGSAGGFSYTPLTGCAPLLVHFKAAISNVPTVVWDFSDGTTSKTSLTDTASHVYTLPGKYVPKLILSDNTGCEASSQGLDTIMVNKVYPDFTTVPSPVCVNAPMSFLDKSTSYFSTISAWVWTFNNGEVSTVSAPSYVFTVEGTYPVNLVVSDAWGCTDSVLKNVMVYPPPAIDAGADTVICLTDKATLLATGGVTYTWAAPATLSCTACNPTKAGPVVATTYTVTGTDEHGCSNTDTVLVSIRTKTESHATGDTAVCRGTVVQLHDSGGTKYQWYPGTGLSSATVASPFATPDITTRYTVVAQLGSCVPDTEVVWLTIYPLPTVDAGPNQRLVEGSTAQLEATGTLVEKWSWTVDPTLTCEQCPNPQATMTVTTVYKIMVTSSRGCKAYDTVKVEIYCDESQLFVPNTFTPNGDGTNDIFYPRGVGVSSVKSFRIYNRWGQLLFERKGIPLNDATNAWDGTYNGAEARPDVYVYVLEAICLTGEPINIKGDVTILR